MKITETSTTLLAAIGRQFEAKCQQHAAATDERGARLPYEVRDAATPKHHPMTIHLVSAEPERWRHLAGEMRNLILGVAAADQLLSQDELDQFYPITWLTPQELQQSQRRVGEIGDAVVLIGANGLALITLLTTMMLLSHVGNRVHLATIVERLGGDELAVLPLAVLDASNPDAVWLQSPSSLTTMTDCVLTVVGDTLPAVAQASLGTLMVPTAEIYKRAAERTAHGLEPRLGESLRAYVKRITTIARLHDQVVKLNWRGVTLDVLISHDTPDEIERRVIQALVSA